jgi:hypothetical protein
LVDVGLAIQPHAEGKGKLLPSYAAIQNS